MSDYKVGAKISFVVPLEPEPMSVVIDEDGVAWQNRPGPDEDHPWKSTAGEVRAWAELVSKGALKLVHLG
jgi:hypothetical protein